MAHVCKCATHAPRTRAPIRNRNVMQIVSTPTYLHRERERQTTLHTTPPPPQPSCVCICLGISLFVLGAHARCFGPSEHTNTSETTKATIHIIPPGLANAKFTHCTRWWWGARVRCSRSNTAYYCRFRRRRRRKTRIHSIATSR